MPVEHGRAAAAVPFPELARLVLLPPQPSPPDPSPEQLAFLAERAQLLPRAAASGDRLVTALYLILLAHAAGPAGPGTGAHLGCLECRPERYPCPTAQQAFWALDAVLR